MAKRYVMVLISSCDCPQRITLDVEDCESGICNVTGEPCPDPVDFPDDCPLKDSTENC